MKLVKEKDQRRSTLSPAQNSAKLPPTPDVIRGHPVGDETGLLNASEQKNAKFLAKAGPTRSKALPPTAEPRPTANTAGGNASESKADCSKSVNENVKEAEGEQAEAEAHEDDFDNVEFPISKFDFSDLNTTEITEDDFSFFDEVGRRSFWVLLLPSPWSFEPRFVFRAPGLAREEGRERQES
jgi:hypothetical protein